jgi:hypothetical protein
MLLQEADNFLLGTGIVSHLYMGETLVWPVPSGNFWQFIDNPFNKTLSGFRVVYNNGNVFADWGDGNVSGINSNFSYNYTWGLGLSAFTLFTGNICRTQIPPPEARRTTYSYCPNIFQLGCRLYSEPNGITLLSDGEYSNVGASVTLTILNGDVVFTGLCIPDV